MITGSGNAKLKMIRQLLKSREMRDTEGLFAAEGRKIFEEVPEEHVREIYVSESFFREHEEELRNRGFYVSDSAFGAESGMRKAGRTLIDEAAGRGVIEIVSDSRFGSISDTKNPQGVIALLAKPEWEIEDIFKKKAPLLLLAEHLQDPGNAGTILRTAEAAGADAVILTKESVDIFNPKVVRATMGSIFRMPVFYVESAAACCDMLRARGIRSYAAYLPGSTVYDAPNYTGGTCFLIGNESRGLTDEAAAAADERIRIPMTEHINSLNAAMAGGILLYEAARQRRI